LSREFKVDRASVKRYNPFGGEFFDWVCIFLFCLFAIYLLSEIFSANLRKRRLRLELLKAQEMVQKITLENKMIKEEIMALKEDPIYLERFLRHKGLLDIQGEHIIKGGIHAGRSTAESK
jgi:hypothetical protein